MKKRNIEYEEREENAFSLSTGDLMAGLLFIFVLLLMGALLQVQEKAEQDEEIVKRYDQIKTQLYIDLQEEFIALLQKVDKSKSAVKQSLEKLETLKKSLMQEYFG